MSIKSEKISTFQLAMITVAFVASLRSLAPMSEYGLSCIFYYLVATFAFLVPSALVSAELATTYPARGAVCEWVTEAFGPRLGFLAVWLQFLSNVINLPAFLSFLVTTGFYVIKPDLVANKYFIVCTLLVVLWGTTFLSFRGMKTAGWVNTFGVTIGTFIPVVMIITLGLVWYFSGSPLQTEISWKAFFPKFSALKMQDIVFLAALLFSLTGLESSGSHALDLKDTKRGYPRAMMLTALFVSMIGLGAVSIAMVVPFKEINILTGIVQSFAIFFQKFNMAWFAPVLGIMIFVGGVSSLNSSLIGPSKSFFGAATGGEIPPILTKTNKHGMPVNMFVFQAILISILSMLFFLMPSISSSYWLIMGMVIILYLFMYVLIFSAAIVLRFKHPNINRPYQVPFGRVGLVVLASLGLISTIFGMVICFLPPSQINVGDTFTYEMLLVIGILVFAGIGLLIYHFRKSEWVRKNLD